VDSAPARAIGAEPVSRGPARWLWLGAGCVAVGIGGVGVVVPGLPTTVFFIIAASCFARSSPRFERWVLELPRIGPLVRDHRAGLGMPRRAKVWAIGMMLFFATASAVFAADHLAVSAAIIGLALIGTWYISCRVPTRPRAVVQD
jgi:uncharacterized protein